jgi:hypothetical protein
MECKRIFSMKTMPVEVLGSHISDLVAAAPKDRVLLTRLGKPFAIVSSASKLDAEDIGYISDPTFWEMSAERRKTRGGVPLEQVEARIAAEEKRSKSKQRRNAAANHRKNSQL